MKRLKFSRKLGGNRVMLADDICHFWYSAKQKRVAHDPIYAYFGQLFGGGPRDDIFVVIDGKPVEYTECGTKDTPSGNWDDYRYIGRAPMSAVKFRRQLEAETLKSIARDFDRDFLRDCGITGGIE